VERQLEKNVLVIKGNNSMTRMKKQSDGRNGMRLDEGRQTTCRMTPFQFPSEPQKGKKQNGGRRHSERVIFSTSTI
jgi:hypothetical protein